MNVVINLDRGSCGVQEGGKVQRISFMVSLLWLYPGSTHDEQALSWVLKTT